MLDDSAPMGELQNIAGVRVVDTRAMEWSSPPEGEPFHGTLTKTKVLARAAEGWPIVQMLSRSAGARSSYPHGQAERHYHRTVREWVYILSGTLALREFPNMNDSRAIPVDYREGFFLDRHPGRLTGHGLNPEGSSDGYIGLEFRSGPGQAPGERGHDDENVSVLDGEIASDERALDEVPPGFSLPFEQPEALVYETGHVRIVDTRQLRWTKSPHSSFGGAEVNVRSLSQSVPDEYVLDQVHLGRTPGSEIQSHKLVRRELWFVLSGAGVIEVAQKRIDVMAGNFVDFAAGSERRVVFDALPPTGMVILVWQLPHPA